MNLPPSIQIKPTKKLFDGVYQYKASLRSAGAHLLRGGDVDYALERSTNDMRYNIKRTAKNKNLLDLEKEYLQELCKGLKNCKAPYGLRIESPIVNFYTNDVADLEMITKLNPSKVRYVSMPVAGTEQALAEGTVIVKNIDFSFKVTMGRTRQSFDSFVAWCKDNDKIKLTKSAELKLSLTHSWGGYYFYVKDDKTLLMVKMFLGSHIQKVENVVKA